MRVRRAGGAIAGVLLASAFAVDVPALGGPFANLSMQMTLVFATLLAAIIWWIAGVLPEYLTGLVMSVAFVLIAGVPVDAAFCAFSEPTWWLLVAAFCLSCGMRKSGLLRRMSQAVLRRFPQTFRGQAAGLMAAGLLTSPFIPSLTAKCAVLMPMALEMSDGLGYRRRGKRANGLFLMLFTSIRTAGPAVISASFLGYVLLGLLPESVAAQFDIAHWFLAALPWLVVVLVLNYVAIVVLFGPDEDGAVVVPGVEESNAESGAGVSAEYGVEVGVEASGTGDRAGGVASADESLRPMSADEKKMLAIMVVTVLLWVFERWHGIPSFAIALIAVAVMTACGLFGRDDLRAGVAWDTVVFMGVVLSLGEVFASVGADGWLIQTCAPLLMPLAGNSYALVLGIALITIALRFIIVSETAFINIFMVFTVPLAAQLGLSPWVIGFCVYAVVNPWFAKYQNPLYLAALGAIDDQMTSHAPVAGYCAVYLAICLVGLLASVPYWHYLGLL